MPVGDLRRTLQCYEEKLPLYDKLASKCPRFERKGKSMVFTSANGYMFSQLNKAGELGIRFSDEVQKKYMEEWGSTTFKSCGATLRGYVRDRKKCGTTSTGWPGT